MPRRSSPCAALVLLLAACGEAAPPLLDGDGAVRATLEAAPREETDEPPSFRFDVETAHGRIEVQGRAAVVLRDGRAAFVDDEQRLVLLEPGIRRALLDRVIGAPAALPDGRILAVRTTGPGESDLWLVDPSSARPPRALAAGPGAEGMPFPLEDGRVLFTSDRSGVTSIFVVALDGRGLRQLTNEGERPGRLSPSFVPPPLRWLEQRGDLVLYDDGQDLRSLDVETGAAEVVR